MRPVLFASSVGDIALIATNATRAVISCGKLVEQGRSPIFDYSRTGHACMLLNVMPDPDRRATVS